MIQQSRQLRFFVMTRKLLIHNNFQKLRNFQIAFLETMRFTLPKHEKCSTTARGLIFLSSNYTHVSMPGNAKLDEKHWWWNSGYKPLFVSTEKNSGYDEPARKIF